MKLEIEISAETEARLREMSAKWASSEDLGKARTLAVEAKLHLQRGVREGYEDFKRFEARKARQAAEAQAIAAGQTLSGEEPDAAPPDRGAGSQNTAGAEPNSTAPALQPERTTSNAS